MTITPTVHGTPAVLGGTPAFPDGLALLRPTLRDLPDLTGRLADILQSGVLTNGPNVAELEERVADRLGVAHVIAVASCTSGLALTFQALGVRGNVVMPSFTFSAGPHAVMWSGGTPVFADISPDTLCLDIASVSERLAGAAAISATHVYGTPCRSEALQTLANQSGVPLVFDAAHGLGSVRQGVPIGGFGVAEVFSLSPTKVVVAGEGGLVATNDPGLARTLRLARNYGNPGNYDCLFPGLNARMSELHAAVALHSLASLDENVIRRNRLVNEFWDSLGGVRGLRRPGVDPGDVSTYKDLTVIVDELAFGLSTRQLAAALDLEGIETRRYFHPPVHAQVAYQHLPRRSLPVTNAIAPMVLSLPLWSHMSLAQVRGVADALQRLHVHAPRVRTHVPAQRDAR